MKIRMHSLLCADVLAFLFFAFVSGHVAADQLSEDWRSAATESLRSGRSIVAVFGDVAPSLKDELAAALTNEYVLVQIGKPGESDYISDNPDVKARRERFRSWDIGEDESAVLLIRPDDSVIGGISARERPLSVPPDGWLATFRKWEDSARVEETVIKPLSRDIRHQCSDFEHEVRTGSLDRESFLCLATNTIEKVRSLRKQMRDEIPKGRRGLAYREARKDAKVRLSELRQMTNEVCSTPPSNYTVPVPPDDWRLSKWRGINDIEDWIAYVNENPQLPKYADFRRNKMLPFLRRELQVADRAESREFVDYVLETIAHGEMRSSFSVNRPNQGLTQEAKRLESLGDTQPLVRLFAAMDTAGSSWSDAIKRLSALEAEWEGRRECALLSAISSYYRNAPSGSGYDEQARKVPATQDKFVEWCAGLKDEDVRQACFVLVVFFRWDIEGLGERLLQSAAPPWLGYIFRGHRSFCLADVYGRYTEKPDLMRKADEYRVQSKEDLETAYALHPEIPESANLMAMWNQWLGTWEKRQAYHAVALQAEFDNEHVWRDLLDYDRDRQWGATSRGNTAFGYAMMGCTRFDTLLPSFAGLGQIGVFGARRQELLEALQKVLDQEGLEIWRRVSIQRRILRMLLEDGRYEDFRDRVLQWRGALTWRLCMLGDMPSCPSDFGELLDIVQSPRAETYIALQRLCRDDSPHEFFKAFNSLRYDAADEIPENEREYLYGRLAWMSRRLHPRVEEDLYRHYEPHANWTNWLPHVVLEIPPSWDEFRKRTYIPFLEGLKGIGMIDDPVLYFGATNETALGWFPVEERTDREWEDIADWLCRQDLTSDDSLRCAYILARRAVVGEAKDLFVRRLEKGGVDKWLLLMLRGGAMNRLAACGLRPEIPESWMQEKNSLLQRAQVLCRERDSLVAGGAPRLRSWYLGSPYDRPVRRYEERMRQYCYGDSSVTNVTLAQLVDRQRTNATETARSDYSAEAIDAFESLVGNRSPYSIVKYLEGSRAPTARWRAAMGLLARRLGATEEGRLAVGELQQKLGRQLVADWFVGRLAVDLGGEHALSVRSAAYLPDDAASHVDSATCLLKRYEGDRTQFYANKFAREELLPEARKHLVSALYTEPDNEEAVRLAVVYGFKYQEFAELSNAIREFTLSRPIWEKLHTAEEARLVEIARREKAAMEAEAERVRRAEREKREKDEAKIAKFRASPLYKQARSMPGNVVAQSGLWHDYVSGEGREFADNETFKRNVFMPFFAREFGIDEKDPKYREMMDFLEREFADPLCWTGDCEAWVDRRLTSDPSLDGGMDRAGRTAWELFRSGCTNTFIVASAYYCKAWFPDEPRFDAANRWRISDDRRDDAARFIANAGYASCGYGRDRYDEVAQARRVALLTWVRHLEGEGMSLAQWRAVEMFILRICGRRGLRYDRNGKENLIPRPGRDLADTLEKEAVALPLARLLREDPAFK